jgi:hypothetical protein
LKSGGVERCGATRDQLLATSAAVTPQLSLLGSQFRMNAIVRLRSESFDNVGEYGEAWLREDFRGREFGYN